MSNAEAFTKHIGPVGSGGGEHNSVHQTSPAWVLTFVRWENRDTFRTPSVVATEVRKPMVVENDCIQVTVNVSKGTLTPSMAATLKVTDVNYLTSLSPGDFVIVNMLNSEEEARRVANQARAQQPINGINDGFKGIFKIQSPRESLHIDPDTGTKTLVHRISGFAFTEYNNTIYFNPYLIDPNQDPKNLLLFASYLGKDWTSLVNDKGLTNIQNILALLIQSFIGSGVSDQGRFEKNGLLKSPNVHFFLPEMVGKLMDVQGAKAAKDIYVHIFGIQKYAAGEVQTLTTGFNCSDLTQKFQRIYYTSTPCAGDTFLKPEYWNQVKAWSILNQYTNSPLNELFTCFRVSPEGKIMPTVVFRQIPFTNQDFPFNYPVTKYLSLPRWKISPALIAEHDLGKDEAARVNFVQYFGRSTVSQAGAEIALEIARKNFAYDIEDVQRSGLRPYIVTTQFDEPTTTNKEYRSPQWAQILGDALIGGQLKMNGTMTVFGIVDPIAVGDNLEYNSVVYHIESISHTCSISVQDGKKMFRTQISLSSGISTSSTADGTRYPQMDNPGAYAERQNDYDNLRILPGVSEEQDVTYRPNDLSAPVAGNKAFPQPKGKPTPEDGDI